MVLSCIVVLGYLEWGTRVARSQEFPIYQDDPDFGFRFTPNVAAYNKTERINSAGWRGPERDYSPRPDRLRIACMGDSVVFGPRSGDEFSYPRQLEGLLRNHFKLQDAEVFNFAVPGFGSFHGTLLMQKFIPMVKPQIVLLHYGRTDLALAGWFDDRERLKFLTSFWYRSSLVRYLEWKTGQWLSDWRRSRRLRVLLGPSILKQAQTLKEIDANLRQMVARAQEDGMIPVLITSPWGQKGKAERLRRFLNASDRDRQDLIPGYDYEAYNVMLMNEGIRRLANETGTRLVDLEAVFDALPQEELQSYFFDYTHLNEKGSRLAAESLAPAVRDAVLRLKVAAR